MHAIIHMCESVFELDCLRLPWRGVITLSNPLLGFLRSHSSISLILSLSLSHSRFNTHPPVVSILFCYSINKQIVFSAIIWACVWMFGGGDEDVEWNGFIDNNKKAETQKAANQVEQTHGFVESSLDHCGRAPDRHTHRTCECVRVCVCMCVCMF